MLSRRTVLSMYELIFCDKKAAHDAHCRLDIDICFTRNSEEGEDQT